MAAYGTISASFKNCKSPNLHATGQRITGATLRAGAVPRVLAEWGAGGAGGTGAGTHHEHGGGRERRAAPATTARESPLAPCDSRDYCLPTDTDGINELTSP